MLGDYGKFKQSIYGLTQIDLNSYREKQMRRRIDTLITSNKAMSYEAYVKLIQEDSKKLEQFINFLTINVSEFYRNPEQWKRLDHEIIPRLIRTFGKNLKVWSAACSTGNEPYSLVMALSRFMPLNRINVIATDIDRQVLDAARLGCYDEKSIAGVPEDFKRRYFRKVGKSYQISKDIKARVCFQQHNLLLDTYPSGCHLIVCRNVLIYFTEEARDEVYQKFHQALFRNGILFIGSTEQMMNYKELHYQKAGPYFFSKE